MGSQAKHLFNNNKLLKRLQSLIHVGTCPGIKIAPGGPPVIVTQRALCSVNVTDVSQAEKQHKLFQYPIRASGLDLAFFFIQFIWITDLIELHLACLADANSVSA